MPNQSANTASTLKAAVSVSQMAKLLGLSRSHLYELIGQGIFYPPVYSVTDHRPFFPRDIQEANLRIRVDQIGANGQFVIFYERQPRQQTQSTTATASRRQNNVTSSLLQNLRSLGLTDATRPQIEQALTECFPNGTAETDESTVLRTVYRHIRRSGTS